MSSKIWSLFWPIVITMTISTGMAIVDTIMVGLYNPIGSSAIAINMQLAIFIDPLFYAIIGVTTAYVVQYSERDKKLVPQYFAMGVSLIVPVTIIVFTFLLFFGDKMLNILTSSPEIYEMALSYFTFAKFTIPLVGMDLFMMKIFRATKNQKIIIWISIFSLFLNITLNYIFIYGNLFGVELGVAGAAMATLITKTLVIIAYVVIAYYKKLSFVSTNLKLYKYPLGEFKVFISRVIPETTGLILESFGRLIYLFIYALTGGIGFLVYNAAMSISSINNGVFHATTNCVEIFTAEYIAKDDPTSQKKMMRSLFKLQGITYVYLLISGLFIMPIFTPLFSSSPDASKILHEMIILFVVVLGVNLITLSFDVMFRAGGQNKFIMKVKFIAIYLIGIPLTILAFFASDGNMFVVYLALLGEFGFRIGVSYYYYRKDKWNNKLYLERK